MSQLDSKQRVIDLFVSAGYAGARNASVSALHMLIEGLAWCIVAASNPNSSEVELLQNPNFIYQENTPKILEVIEAALKSIGCPFAIQAYQIQDLDYNAVLQAVQWVVDHIPNKKPNNNEEVTYLMDEIEREEHTAKQLVKEMDDAEHAIDMLNADLKEQNLKKIHMLNEMNDLRAKIDKESDNSMVEKLKLLLESVKDIEMKDFDLRSYCEQNHSSLPDDVLQVVNKIPSYKEGYRGCDDSEHYSCDTLEKLNSAKRDLAVKLREVVSLKRKLDYVPCQSELVQYEQRFAELNAQIQEKHRQTRKYYATYNALLEIKELFLKETSLLNSIISQFNDAITNPAGRIKLIDSMEGIVKGTQQKLSKVQLGLQNEQKLCDALKEKHAGLVTDRI